MPGKKEFWATYLPRRALNIRATRGAADLAITQAAAAKRRIAFNRIDSNMDGVLDREEWAARGRT